MTGFIKINGIDAFTAYGLILLRGAYEELLKAPKPKGGYAKSWDDEHGTERDFSAVYLESRILNIPVLLKATSETDFYTKYNALTNFLWNTGYFNFDVVQMNRRFMLCYQEMTPFSKLTLLRGNDNVAAEFNVQLVDDFPHLNTPIPA